MRFFEKYTPGFLLAVTLHSALMGAFLLNLPVMEKPIAPTEEKTPEIIQASILDETLVTQKAEELQQAKIKKLQLQQKKQTQLEKKIRQEQQRLQQATQQRQQAEKKAQQARKEEQQRLAAIQEKIVLEKKQQADLQAKRVAAEKQRQVEAAQIKEAARKAEEVRLKVEQQRLIVEEQQRVVQLEKEQQAALLQAEKAKVAAALRAKNARIAKVAVANATKLIDAKVTQSWNRPNNISSDLRCSLQVNLIPTGDVMLVKVVKSSGNKAFDASAERAVYKASPLPVPQDNRLFEAKFRRFNFNFSPK